MISALRDLKADIMYGNSSCKNQVIVLTPITKKQIIRENKRQV